MENMYTSYNIIIDRGRLHYYYHHQQEQQHQQHQQQQQQQHLQNVLVCK